MSDEALEHLLDRLNRGEIGAAGEVFVAYEPYLRMVVRRQLTPRLRSRFDSVDIVQSVWVDLLDGFRDAAWQFADVNALRAFLVRSALNRFIDRLRQNQTSLDREEPLGPAQAGAGPLSVDPAPSEVAQANDVWQQLLSLCTPLHRQVLELKQAGIPLAEIATRTGLHPSSVRRILYDLARDLALKQTPIGQAHPSADAPRATS